MSSGVVIQGNFPIPEERRDQLQQLATELNREQLMWLSGYFAGAAAAAPSSIPGFQNNLLSGAQARAQHPSAAAPAAVAPLRRPPRPLPAPSLTIISASHTGNGRKISEKLLAAVQALGMQARMIKAGDYQPREIAKEKLLYIVISTHGDGDPPDEARGLYEFLGTKRAPQLPELQYSVLALGDTSYPKFCEAGRVVDERLAKLGAKRLLPRVDCDVDFEKLAQTWADDALARVRESSEKFTPAGGAATPLPSRRTGAGRRRAARARNPATAEVLANQRIVGRSALREVRHVELAFPGLGNLYKPGDALGIVHRNPDSAIDAVLKATKLDGGASVTHDGKTHTLHEWLRDERELTRIARPLLVQVAKQAKVDISELLGNARRPWRNSRPAARCPTCWPATRRSGRRRRWSSTLRPVTGRVYSIASSPAAVGDEAHLTVAVVGSDTDRKLLAGAASHFVVNTPADSATCRCGSSATSASAFRRTARATSSWSARAPASRRSAASCRSARRRGATGKQLAVLRRPLAVSRFPLPARMAAGAEAQVAASRRRRVLARPGARRSTCSIASRRPARSCSPGCRTAPISMCAATLPPWRPT